MGEFQFEEMTVHELIRRLPGGVSLDDAKIEYAGCGTHMVLVTWSYPQQRGEASEETDQSGDVDREPVTDLFGVHAE